MRPIHVPRKEPAMPMSIVIQMPPGSLPGMMNLAIAPTTRPMRAVQSRCSIAVPPYWVPGAAGHVSIVLEKHTPTTICCKVPADRHSSLSICNRVFFRKDDGAEEIIEFRKLAIEIGVSAFKDWVLMAG